LFGYNEAMANSLTQPVYIYTFVVPQDAIDENGHVNNVHYVQWMQDVAVRHYEFIGGVPPMQALGATWVVRSHHIEYLAPAFAGDEIEIRTWVVNVRRVRSLRRYEFVRKSDGRLLSRGETDWVFVNAVSGRPLAIPEEVVHLFPLLTENE
jgi:acyl-CoA thioester hydrolase